MTDPVAVPFWLLLLILAFAAITLASHFLFPSVRWFFRKRAEKALARLNKRLDRPIEFFKLARRQDMIVRLSYDPRVLEAVADHAAETGVPGSVAFEEARRYAREIVPGFSATLYFGVAIRLARWLSRLAYRVRIGKVDAALAHIDPKATVIFVMNHRSNMDYVLITWLVANRSAISYAVGEWARIWPLSALIRTMGAYFIRRGSRNTLYRRVLARYVQMATSEGTTQAIFPEGGLSLDGRVGAAKMGLLSYIVSAYEPGGRDVVFVPVGLAYDRVLEDRILTNAAEAGTRRFRGKPLAIIGFLLRNLWRKFRGRFKGFGTAAAGFGPPVSLRGFLADAPDTPTEELGAHLMAEIVKVVPVLPVPLVAAALLENPPDRAALAEAMLRLQDRLGALGAVMKLPPQGIEATLDEGLAPLLSRGLISENLQITQGSAALIGFYAAPVAQRLAPAL
ncbi:1-acyl-sn-glycerol-3-phosphate acyltransferase [Cypionkella sp.]|uniref:1-acyl-sn-glycerol-3-phosphate acyltransferase n=1 Tax=Cypionkella sp. TaxID=2811411 RepID=UPI002ABA8340|nr:1-acyl-sn-glycerol-3-phosphate acyltransferase [Cypionkella sp.]MDZ4395982.1 1-acyl-sn-glycerol-3-phosphate acyltransferase [Cypionkella sp.]